MRPFARWLFVLGAILYVFGSADAYWQSRLQVSVGSAPAYTGPGDISGGAIYWFGLRAYSGAYAASHGNVVLVCGSTGVSCVTVTANTNGSITLPGATACGGAACTLVKTLYDQSGNGNDVTQTTAANMPAFSTASLGGLPTAVFTSVNSTCLQGGNTSSLSAPLTYSFVVNKVSDNGINFAYFGLNIQVAGTANRFRMFDGSNVLDAVATDGSFHAAQFVDAGSGASASQAYIDGSATTGTMSGSGTSGGNPINIGGNACSNNYGDQVLADWNKDFSSPDVRASMNSNQHTYWGF